VSDDEATQLVTRAKEIVKALAIAQVGQHHSMANLEALAQIDQFEDDPDLLYAVLRVFSGAMNVLAGVHTSDAIHEESGQRFEEITIEFIRRAVDDLDATAHRLDD
jgi:hypothetical protein